MARNKKAKKYPDAREKRPSDPNQLARWIVKQSTKIAENQLSDSAKADSYDQ